MHYRGGLLFGHFWSKHKCLHMETVKKEFELVGLHNIVAINDKFTLDQRKFLKDECHQELILIILAHDIIMIYLFKF
jgi:hypothetical protein